MSDTNHNHCKTSILWLTRVISADKTCSVIDMYQMQCQNAFWYHKRWQNAYCEWHLFEMLPKRIQWLARITSADTTHSTNASCHKRCQRAFCEWHVSQVLAKSILWVICVRSIAKTDLRVIRITRNAKTNSVNSPSQSTIYGWADYPHTVGCYCLATMCCTRTPKNPMPVWKEINTVKFLY